MWNGIIFSTMLVGIFFFLGAILTSISFLLLAPIIHTPKKDLDQIIKIIKPEKGDNILDLGSGDGRVLIEASKIATIKGKGVDVSPLIVMLSKLNKYLNIFKARNIELEVENLFSTKLKGFNKIYCYTSEKYLNILEKRFEKELMNTIVYTYLHPLPSKEYSEKHLLSTNHFLYTYIYK